LLSFIRQFNPTDKVRAKTCHQGSEQARVKAAGESRQKSYACSQDFFLVLPLYS